MRANISPEERESFLDIQADVWSLFESVSTQDLLMTCFTDGDGELWPTKEAYDAIKDFLPNTKGKVTSDDFKVIEDEYPDALAKKMCRLYSVTNWHRKDSEGNDRVTFSIKKIGVQLKNSVRAPYQHEEASYIVDLEENTCGCEGFRIRSHCKHVSYVQYLHRKKLVPACMPAEVL